MSEKTLTRMELSEAVFRSVGLSRNESAELVEKVLHHMSDANPKTGEEVPIEPRRVLTFRPSHIMKERVDMCNKR